MKKSILLSNKTKVLFPVFVLFIVLLISTDKIAIANSFSPPTGMTGSPADGANCSACHSSSVMNLTTGITTDIPVGGYVPGTEYTISIGNEIAQSGKTRYGFSMTAQNTTGTLLGTFTAGSGTSVNGKYISHSGAQTTSTPSWQFKWTAPVKGTGVVNFYTAVNAANDNKGTSGDQILTSVVTVQEAIANSVNEADKNKEFKAFLNANNLNLAFNSNAVSMFYLQIIDINGSVVLTKHINGNVGENTSITALENSLSTGVYIVKLSDFKQQFQSKIIVN